MMLPLPIVGDPNLSITDDLLIKVLLEADDQADSSSANVFDGTA